jgi:hypothetical protein
LSNRNRWRLLVEQGDVPGLRRAMTGLDTDSVQMREVSLLVACEGFARLGGVISFCEAREGITDAIEDGRYITLSTTRRSNSNPQPTRLGQQ